MILLIEKWFLGVLLPWGKPTALPTCPALKRAAATHQLWASSSFPIPAWGPTYCVPTVAWAHMLGGKCKFNFHIKVSPPSWDRPFLFCVARDNRETCHYKAQELSATRDFLRGISLPLLQGWVAVSEVGKGPRVGSGWGENSRQTNRWVYGHLRCSQWEWRWNDRVGHRLLCVVAAMTEFKETKMSH